jgi:hypothetical protein
MKIYILFPIYIEIRLFNLSTNGRILLKDPRELKYKPFMVNIYSTPSILLPQNVAYMKKFALDLEKSFLSERNLFAIQYKVN